jgi:hypothetical protein
MDHIRTLTDMSGNVRVVDELTFMRVKGQSAAMLLTHAIWSSQRGLHDIAAQFQAAALLSLDRFFGI